MQYHQHAEEEYQQQDDQQEAAAAVEMLPCFHRIEELAQHGINNVDITKLKAGGYNTVESVSTVPFSP